MPVRNCCLGCQGYMPGPCSGCGYPSAYRKECSGVGPCCTHSFDGCCCAPCSGAVGCIHGARGGLAGSYYSCGQGCIGGCIGGVCGCCCGPACI